MLSYNFVFARGVQKHLVTAIPRYLYQRHCAFSIAGALLSRRLKVPLILEYNGPEVWIADHWDPNPLRNWITLCEEVTLRCAARIIVVSDALRERINGERDSGRSHSGKSEWRGSGLFLSRTRERRLDASGLRLIPTRC